MGACGIGPSGILRPGILVCLLLAASAAGWNRTAGESASRGSYERGRELVLEALEALGRGPESPPPDLLVTAEGTLDRAARYQGYRPDEPQPDPYREEIALRPDGSAAWEFQFRRFDGAEEGTRFARVGGDRMRIVGLVDSFAVEVTEPALAASSVRVAQSLPPVILAEALRSGAGLRHLGTAPVAGRETELVGFAADGGELITLHFSEGRLRGWEFLVNAPLWGDATLRWELGEYRSYPGVGTYPGGHRVYLEGRLLKDVEHVAVVSGAAASSSPFGVPEGLEVRVIPPPEDDGSGPPAPRVEEVAPGIRIVRGLRSGFNLLFAELPDGILVVDAVAGWLEMATEVPPSDFAGATSSSSLSERLLDLIHATVPGKPVRWVVLTHFHSDHAGGVRAFVAEGATVVGAGPTREVVERAVARPHTIAPDRLSRNPRPLRYREVEGSWSPGRGVEILEAAPNPHAEGMLVVHFPGEDLLYVSDLLYTEPLGSFPSPGEEALARAFVRWLDDSGLSPGRIVGSHGGAVAGPEHLGKLRAR